MYKILINKIKIIKNKIKSRSQVKISLELNEFKLTILFNLLPIKMQNIIIGEEPITVAKINLVEGISNSESNIFWINKGGPGINLKMIKYSNVDPFINLCICLVYLS